MATIHELQCPIEVETPKGRAMAFLITEYGWEQPKLFTCIVQETGEIWEFLNHQIKATKNITFGRTYDGKKESGSNTGRTRNSNKRTVATTPEPSQSIDRVWATESFCFR